MFFATAALYECNSASSASTFGSMLANVPDVFLEVPPSSPASWSPARPSYESERGPNMMMAMPARLTATPTQSVVVGLTLSTSISHISATPT